MFSFNSDSGEGKIILDALSANIKQLAPSLTHFNCVANESWFKEKESNLDALCEAIRAMTKARSLLLGGNNFKSANECDKLVEAVAANRDVNDSLIDVEMSDLGGHNNKLFSEAAKAHIQALRVKGVTVAESMMDGHKMIQSYMKWLQHHTSRE